MARIPGSDETLDLLVNCKTYPAVSTKYVETVCTGGVQRDGQFVRLYPVPYRFLERDEQYKRWDVIRVRAYRDTKDQRPESWHLLPGGPIEIIQTISSETQRWDWMRNTVHQSLNEMDLHGITNGCVQIQPIEFYWKAEPKEWTPSQLSVIHQGDLFATADQKRNMAKQVPYQFRLKFRELSTGKESDLKVLAWSYYQGFLRFLETTGDESAAMDQVADKVRRSIFNPERAVFGIFGTHSRFGHWMISSLYHLPTAITKSSQSKARLF